MVYLQLFFQAAGELLVQSSLYILFGLVIAGLLKVFLSPEYVAAHLGKGRFKSVFKAALLGIPIPLCSCGVLPAAAQLKKQGANNGATTAFLISTPESGVDSIAITWALLDPIMTIARPIAAFVTAFTAGGLENLLHYDQAKETPVSLKMATASECDQDCCVPSEMKRRGPLMQLKASIKYAVNDVWGDLASWFFIGIILAAIIMAVVPDAFITSYLGGGIVSMLLMLVIGIPMYICATASTPVAAALIIKGVSPGAALVFLLVGPATNITSLSVLVGILGKRATSLYLVSISVMSVICGLCLDFVYYSTGISIVAVMGGAREIFPLWLMQAATVILLLISVKPLYRYGKCGAKEG